MNSQGFRLANFSQFETIDFQDNPQKIKCDACDNEVKNLRMYFSGPQQVFSIDLSAFFVYYKDDSVDFTFREYTKSKFLKKSQNGARRRVSDLF